MKDLTERSTHNRIKKQDVECLTKRFAHNQKHLCTEVPGSRADTIPIDLAPKKSYNSTIVARPDIVARSGDPNLKREGLRLERP